MAENWNYGYHQTSGDYICLLSDKLVFKPNALNKLRELIQEVNPDSITWNCTELMSDTDNGTITGSGNVFRYPTENVIEKFMGMKHSDYSELRIHLPRGFTSCINRKLYDKIISNTGNLSLENTPDYTQAFQILFTAKYVHVVDLSLTGRFNRETKYGTGAQHDLGFIDQAVKSMKSKSTDITSITRQPLKITNTETIVLEDFFRVAEMYGLKYSFNDVNIRNYFKTIFRNTLGRQSYIYPENQEYFKNLKKTIKDSMRQTYSRGLKRDLFVCSLMEIIYYRVHRCGITIFRFMEKHSPLVANFMWSVGVRI